jgi:hypothetical protein
MALRFWRGKRLLDASLSSRYGVLLLVIARLQNGKSSAVLGANPTFPEDSRAVEVRLQSTVDLETTASGSYRDAIYRA